jgi:hypothetical protein
VRARPIAYICALASLAAAGVAAPTRARSDAPPRQAFVLRADGDRVACGEETLDLAPRDDASLHEITAAKTRTGPGLTIVLRGTDQLDRYPAAKAAFVRAAETWERTITGTPITIVVDVDYGSGYFGQPFPANVLGVTDPQTLLLDDDYSFIRSHLADAASDAEEAALYAALPDRAIPTDIGATKAIYAPSAVIRALHFLGPVAKPRAERDRGLGNPPAVAISSAFAYDFDPSDGVDSNARDFEAVVLHELGHVLGFTSAVGSRETSASFPVAVSVLDMFRFRPGVSDATFGSARRVLQAGGDQVFFGGGPELALSTGRQDSSGGDGRQASHWKDEAFTGVFIGLMHPALKPGVHETLTANDLLAFDRIGYTLAPASPSVIASLAAELDGDRVAFAGVFAAPPVAAAFASVTMLDTNYRPVHETERFAVRLGDGPAFSLTVAGFDAYRAALGARLTLFDASGAELGAATASFADGDPGGAEVKRAIYRGRTLTIAGRGLVDGATVEINGVAVPAGTRVAANRAGTRLVVRGEASAIGLAAGYNRVRVVAGGARSNIVVALVE